MHGIYMNGTIKNKKASSRSIEDIAEHLISIDQDSLITFQKKNRKVTANGRKLK